MTEARTKSNYRLNRAFATVAEWIDRDDRSDIRHDESGVITGVQMPGKIVAANEYIRSCGITRNEYERRLKKALLATLRAKVMSVPAGVQ